IKVPKIVASIPTKISVQIVLVRLQSISCNNTISICMCLAIELAITSEKYVIPADVFISEAF
ncbi:hypothetical protein, partial [Campylobacter coli]|uniref:hypothetical protein n=1 Tax=Campylobacter coli TaxID=195 RepID=UPI0037FE2AAE